MPDLAIVVLIDLAVGGLLASASPSRVQKATIRLLSCDEEDVPMEGIRRQLYMEDIG